MVGPLGQLNPLSSNFRENLLETSRPLHPRKVRQTRSAQPRGRVIGQSRKPGAVLPVGTRVNLVLSAGRPFVAPPFTG